METIVASYEKEIASSDSFRKRLHNMIQGKTIPQLFLERVDQKGDDVAFCYKDLGIYNKCTWKAYWKEVEEFALGLLELGLEPGDRVAIMGEPCPEWSYADLAVLSTGAISFGVYSTSSPHETCYEMEKTEAKFFIAENQEYVDKILPFADKFPFLLKIIVADTRATFMYEDPRLISFKAVQALGKKKKVSEADLLRGLIQKGNAEDIAFLVFTSGTTGPSKAAMLTHSGTLLAYLYSFGELYPELETHPQKAVAHLSLAHIVERCFSLYFPLVFNWIPYIGESVEHVNETLFEIQPTFFFGVPRIWEKMAARLITGIESSSPIKKLSYRWAMKVGERYLEMKWSERKIPLTWRFLHWTAVQICFRHLLHHLGLKKVRHALSGAAPFPPEVQRLWQTWGIDVINLYGATEASGVISSQLPGFPKPGDLGKPLSINTVKLADDGELLVYGEGVFAGYWGDEEKTQETIKDGWLYMGEIFELTGDGNLKMIDRKKDIMVTSGGKNLSPTEIENAIKASPYISEVIVFAHGRKFPSALIEIEFETLAEWGRRNKVLYTGFTSLTTHPEVYKLIGKEVGKGNELLARVEQVKKFRIIPQELDPEAGETTPTRKIKRDLMYKMFGTLVEEMYEDREKELLGMHRQSKQREE